MTLYTRKNGSVVLSADRLLIQTDLPGDCFDIRYCHISLNHHLIGYKHRTVGEELTNDYVPEGMSSPGMGICTIKQSKEVAIKSKLKWFWEQKCPGPFLAFICPVLVRRSALAFGTGNTLFIMD